MAAHDAKERQLYSNEPVRRCQVGLTGASAARRRSTAGIGPAALGFGGVASLISERHVPLGLEVWIGMLWRCLLLVWKKVLSGLVVLVFVQDGPT